MKICLGCGQEFEPKSGKQRFCSPKCRLAAFKKGQTVQKTDIGEKEANRIVSSKDITSKDITNKDIPNWKVLGYASVDEHLRAILKKLNEDRDKILKFSGKKRLVVRFGEERSIIE